MRDSETFFEAMDRFVKDFPRPDRITFGDEVHA